MTTHHRYHAILAQGSAVPRLLCGHCNSILSRARISRNPGSDHQDIQCNTIGLCPADDCGAVNCCDDALAQIDDAERLFDIAS